MQNLHLYLLEKDLLDAMVEILPWHKNDTVCQFKKLQDEDFEESAVYAKQRIPKYTVLGVCNKNGWFFYEHKKW